MPGFASRTAYITKLTMYISSGQKNKLALILLSRRNQYVVDCLTSKPLLSVFVSYLPTVLRTDTSAIRFGRILLQNGDDKITVIVPRI